MDIQVNSTTTQFTDDTRYKYVQMQNEKHVCDVMVVTGKHSYVTVIVKNASHKAYKGLGKQFDTPQQAVDNYKTEAIKAMIRYACGVK